MGCFVGGLCNYRKSVRGLSSQFDNVFVTWISCTHPVRTSTAHYESPSASNVVRLAGESVIVHDDKKPSRGSQTEAFVSELMHLLRCDSEAVGVQIRETVKELISYELSPPVYPYLFQCMMSESSKVRGREGGSEGGRDGWRVAYQKCS